MKVAKVTVYFFHPDEDERRKLREGSKAGPLEQPFSDFPRHDKQLGFWGIHRS